MKKFYFRRGLPAEENLSRRRRTLIQAAVLIFLLVMPAIGRAQLDFSDAVTVKIRTYPVKRESGRPIPGPDGMPQPEALSNGRPANLQELPAVPVDENFPGGSVMAALAVYQKENPVAALPSILGLLKNGYIELEIEKSCHLDAVKLQFEHKPGHGFPSVQEAGLTSLMQILVDGVKAAELGRGAERLTARYNNGLSTDRSRDQETIAMLRALRYAIAIRYNPRVKAPGIESLPPQEAKDRFKAEVAKGKPIDGDLQIGPLHLVVKVKSTRIELKPLPPECKSAGKP
jgi:hypothetical protein